MTPSPHKLALYSLLIYQLVAILGVWGLRGMRIRVPETTRAGTPVRLACDYDLERAALYSIKWYRGDEEFYRYVPKEDPPGKVFAVEPIAVDLSQSNEHEVLLRNVQRSLTGIYKCEVSADAPLFHTDIKSAHMTVIEISDYDPTITTDKLKVNIGETVRFTCRSSPSNPASNITWYVNGERTTTNSPTKLEWAANGLQVSRSELQITAGKRTFLNGQLNIKCAASVFSAYHRAAHMVIKMDAMPPEPMMAPTVPLRLSDVASSTSCHNLRKFHSALFFILSASVVISAF